MTERSPVSSRDIALSLMSRAQGLAQGLQLYRTQVNADDLVASLETLLEALNDEWRVFLRKRKEEAPRLDVRQHAPMIGVKNPSHRS
jgi:hypothetical protein